ncbi:YihD family protein [Pasteurella skyensis]|uniref:YihD family protein n=1 Tax=Phocoenobacter skyensis TaxID=97481 RepID=UPI00274596DC|nr:YihD family protein [Pasteurella skyensis]MDP8177373.1 YihD family protein [Pasteurella skyensis]MDP8199969.1 YihD family protein [Pasteurella skyensis]
MKNQLTHRVDEIVELLGEHWRKEPDLSLIDFLTKLAAEVGRPNDLVALTDEVLIYQLKMRGTSSDTVIPGIKKDYEEDFKTALLKARGILKD